MPPKKRKASQSTEKSDDTDVSPTATPQLKKRKKSTVQYDPIEICQELYNAVKNHKTEDGRLLCEAFIRVPKRRSDPEYYNVVTTPIDLLKIQHKIRSDEYEEIDQLTADMELMVNNARAFYKKTSQEYNDANDLWDLYQELKADLMAEFFGEAMEKDNDFDDDEKLGDEDSVISKDEPANGEEESEEEEDLDEEEEEEIGDDADADADADADDDVLEDPVEEKEGIEEEEEDEEPPDNNETEQEALTDDTASRDDQTSICTDDDVENSLEQMFAAVASAKEAGRDLSEMFRLLPPKSKYPDYYAIIREPIDLKMIAMKIQNSEYSSLDDLVKDFNLMVNNARTFNEPGSLIYNDAGTIKKIVQNKKADLEKPKPPKATKTSERIRSKRNTGAHRLSAICAALQYTSDDESDMNSVQDNVSQMEFEEESGAEGSIVDGEDNIQWVLYNTVKFYKNQQGIIMSEPFMKLPSKRIYPDYYEEIKKPMSLLQIQKKIKAGQYETLDAVADDMNLVFENAKRYNIDESKLYKDAVKLQKIMVAKKKELVFGKEPQLEVVPPPLPLEMFLKKEDLETSSEVSIKPATSNSRTSRNRTNTVSEDGPTEEQRKKPSRKSLTPEEALRKRLMTLYNTLYDYQIEGRHLIDIFVTLPSKKDYPDYFQVISEPIDMTMIKNKIQNDKYATEQTFLSDLNLMFNNARHYNEEESQVYRDAEKLAKVLKDRVRSMGILGESPRVGKSVGRSKPKGNKALSPLAQKLQILYNTIKDYTDTRKRVLSTPFMKLPLKTEYPDYYEVIKRPIDMQKVYLRMTSSQYDTVEDMVSDFVLMFDNACKYNEPDSLIYKDALTLQRVCLEKKSELCSDEDSNEVPDVRAAVQELMTTLFISTYNHLDEEGRCYSDSFQEMPQPPEEQDMETGEEKEQKKKKRRPRLEHVKRNLDKGRYRRLDKFQDDIYEVFEYARKVSRTDSQLYEDSVELQKFFMNKRDELCRNGDVLLTPALSYTDRHLQAALDLERKEKYPKEQKEDEEKRKQQQEEDGNKEEEKVECTVGRRESVEFKDQTYEVGDFVYVEPSAEGGLSGRPREKVLEPHIVCIEKLWQDPSGEQWLHGCWFYRPNETYHLATRKFLEKEVFKSDFYDSAPFSRVLGKCYVMFVKDYFKMKPQGFDDKDVFVCESRYSAKQKAFKKIKIWQMPRNEDIRILPREEPLVPVRVASVFAERQTDDRDKSVDEDDETPFLDRVKENIEIENQPGDGNTYYEQYNIHIGCVKLGDCVYVRSDEDRPYIARIDKMWCDKDSNMWFHGPWFVRPNDVDHAPTRLFYKREVFRSTIEDTNPILSIMGKCSVLYFKDFCTSRPTEIPEHDVYICESKYHEAEKSIRKLAKPMKKHAASPKVIDDEIYFFKKPIVPRKEPSPLLLKASQEQYYATEEEATSSQDASMNESFVQPETEEPVVAPTPEPTSTKKSKKKSTGNKPRCPTGYIVFSAEQRRVVQEDNPDLSFGEISRIVGAKWREQSRAEKDRYEEKAKKIAEEQAAKQEAADRAFQESLNMYPPQSPASDHRSQSPASASGRPNTPGSHTQQAQPYANQMQGGYQQQGYQQQGYYPGQQGMQHPATPMHQGMPQHPSMQQQGMPPTPMSHGPMPGMPPMQSPYPHGGMPQGSPHPGMAQGSPHPGMQQPMHPGMHHGATPSGPPQGQMPNGMPPQMQGQYGMTPQRPMSHPGMTPSPGMTQSPLAMQHPGMVRSSAQRPGSAHPPQHGMTTGHMRPPPPQQPGMMGHHPQPGTPQGMVQQGPRHTPVPGQPSHASPAFVDQGQAPPQPMPPPPPPKPPSPMFVAVPPRTQRLVHSEAYLRYIEGLSSEKKTVGDWDRSMNATQENTPLNNAGRLPVDWLGQGVGHHGNAVNALWALRDLMMKDTLTVSRTLEFSQLW